MVVFGPSYRSAHTQPVSILNDITGQMITFTAEESNIEMHIQNKKHRVPVPQEILPLMAMQCIHSLHPHLPRFHHMGNNSYSNDLR